MVYLGLPIKNGGSFHGKLLNNQRVSPLQVVPPTILIQLGSSVTLAVNMRTGQINQDDKKLLIPSGKRLHNYGKIHHFIAR